jgi:trimeric autotransporter adhesin
MRFAAFLLTVALVNAGQFTTSLGDTYPYTTSAIATDSAGNTYVTGSRQLTPPLSTQTDVFVTKLDPSGNVLFTRVFGGSASSIASAIALDPSGNIYIA